MMHFYYLENILFCKLLFHKAKEAPVIFHFVRKGENRCIVIIGYKQACCSSCHVGGVQNADLLRQLDHLKEKYTLQTTGGCVNFQSCKGSKIFTSSIQMFNLLAKLLIFCFQNYGVSHSSYLVKLPIFCPQNYEVIPYFLRYLKVG